MSGRCFLVLTDATRITRTSCASWHWEIRNWVHLTSLIALLIFSGWETWTTVWNSPRRCGKLCRDSTLCCYRSALFFQSRATWQKEGRQKGSPGHECGPSWRRVRKSPLPSPRINGPRNAIWHTLLLQAASVPQTSQLFLPIVNKHLSLNGSIQRLPFCSGWWAWNGSKRPSGTGKPS